MNINDPDNPANPYYGQPSDSFDEEERLHRERVEREMRQIAEYLGFPTEDPTRPIKPEVFHGTTDAILEEIKQKGLVPKAGKGADTWAAQMSGKLTAVKLERGERSQSVYVTEDPRVAHTFAQYAKQVNPGSGAAVLKIKIPREALGRFKPDEESVPWLAAWRTAGKIPPEWIQGVVDQDGELLRGLEGDDDDGGKTIYVVILTDEEKERALGGPGSGNFGHAGRPGQVGGSAPSSISARDLSIGDELVGRMSKDGNEHGVVFDADGNELGRSIGDDAMLSMPHADWHDPLAALTWHHTHPVESSFSRTDVVTFADRPGTAAIFAHTPTRTYKAERIPGVDDRTLYFTARDEVFPRHHDLALERFLKHNDRAKYRQETFSAHHDAMLELDKRGLLKYSWVSRKIRTLEAAIDEGPLHAAADAFVPKLSVAFRYAFAMGRKAIKPMLAELRTAGGPGSGNFGHAGRPGLVGGSASSVSFTGAGAAAAREAISKVPAKVRTESVTKTVEAHPSVEKVTDAAESYLLRNYGVTVEEFRHITEGQTIRSLVDRGKGHVISESKTLSLYKSYAQSLVGPIRRAQRAGVKEKAFVGATSAALSGLFTHPVQEILSFTNPFTALIEGPLQPIFEDWGFKL